MGVRPPAPSAPVQRERVDDRPAPRLQVEIVKPPQHRLRVRPHRRRVRLPRPAPLPPRRLARHNHPPAEITRLRARNPLPPDPQPPTRTGTTAAGPARKTGSSSQDGPPPEGRRRTPQPPQRPSRRHRPAGTAPAARPWQPGHPGAARPGSRGHGGPQPPRTRQQNVASRQAKVTHAETAGMSTELRKPAR